MASRKAAAARQSPPPDDCFPSTRQPPSSAKKLVKSSSTMTGFLVQLAVATRCHKKPSIPAKSTALFGEPILHRLLCRPGSRPSGSSCSNATRSISAALGAGVAPGRGHATEQGGDDGASSGGFRRLAAPQVAGASTGTPTNGLASSIHERGGGGAQTLANRSSPRTQRTGASSMSMV